ncbi:MAG: carboxypeptidase-like regulatory domain-containing protein [Chitinophagaceae bacterium]|nr:carboxypeptidase-like regulatory domain-containing protein [Chitinophagaceae bacterium]
MAKKFQLNIAEPCHEDWDGMTPVEKGKFCGSCQKQVIDFTTMSDRELAQFFKKPSTGSVCGRFMTDQLERDFEIPKKRIPWLRYFFTMAIPAFFLSLKSGAAKTQGQIRVKSSGTDTSGKRIYGELKTLGMISKPVFIRPENKDTSGKKAKDPVCDQLVMGKPAFETIKGEIFQQDPAAIIVVRGRVVNAKGEALEGVLVQLKGKNKTAVTNKTGHFEIKAISGESLDFITIGYAQQSRVISNKQPIEIVMQQEVVVATAGMVVVRRDREPLIRLQVLDEQKNPVPFATIEMDGKVILAADQSGMAELKGKKLKTAQVINISAAGYLPQTLEQKNCNKSGVTQVVTLKAKTDLPEVVLKSTYGMYRKGLVSGTVSVRVTRYTKINKAVKPPALTIYPNPVYRGEQLNLQWNVEKEGYYRFQVLNMAGQIVMDKNIWMDPNATTISLPLPSLPAAQYWLLITGQDDGQKVTGKFIVQ